MGAAYVPKSQPRTGDEMAHKVDLQTQSLSFDLPSLAFNPTGPIPARSPKLTARKRCLSSRGRRTTKVCGPYGPISISSALCPLRAFLLNHSKRLCHVFDLIPNIKAYVDRGVFGSR